MKHSKSITDAFGAQATAYLSSKVHSQGADLDALAAAVSQTRDATVLDIGCGAGHASFAVAPHAREVIAYDLTGPMLATVLDAAYHRGLKNISVQLGPAEHLPFENTRFDWVISRYSAHHWRNVRQSLTEVKRVLKPSGQVMFVDVAGGPEPLLDTYLQTVELLRDGSHVRDYRDAEWLAFFHEAGFHARVQLRWRLPIEFNAWITRIGTPADRVQAIRTLWASAAEEAKHYYALQSDLSFELDAIMVHAQVRH